jgi:hypothetical protein
MMRAVTYLALAFGILVAALGVFGLVAPADFAAAIVVVQKKANLYFLAAGRVAIGVILMLAAGASRTPFLLGTLGVLVVLGGLITPFMAVPLRQSVQHWLAGGGAVPVQAWAGVALVIGSFIVYATAPKLKK